MCLPHHLFSIVPFPPSLPSLRFHLSLLLPLPLHKSPSLSPYLSPYVPSLHLYPPSTFPSLSHLPLPLPPHFHFSLILSLSLHFNLTHSLPLLSPSLSLSPSTSLYPSLILTPSLYLSFTSP